MSAGRVYCDGGSRGNPGPAAAGAVVCDDAGRLLAERGRYLGTATNNVAEYQGVLLGLELARSLKLQTVHLYLDSELIVRQLTGAYRVKAPELRRLCGEAFGQLQRFASWDVRHIPREQNREADKLVNRALDHAENAGMRK